MRTAIRLPNNDRRALGFLSELCTVFDEYGIEIVSIAAEDVAIEADRTVALGDVEVPDAVRIAEYTRAGAEAAAEALVGIRRFETVSAMGITQEEARKALRGVGSRSLKVRVEPSEAGVTVKIRYGERSAKIDVDETVAAVCSALGDAVYAREEQSLETFVVRALERTGKTIAVAESFTGGGIAARLTSVPGASRVFREGIVAYTEEAKTRRLNVSPETLAFDSAVSVNCAYQMAAGLLNASKADFVVATTGYAGPDGKDVGKCFVAVGDRKRVNIYECRFEGTREEITSQGVSTALRRLAEALRSEK